MRKKILILSHSYGMQFLESCNQYAGIFDQDRFDITVAYLTGKADDLITTKTQADHVIFLDLPTRALRGLKVKALWAVLQLCRQHHYDAVICHRYKPTYIMLILAHIMPFTALLFVMHAPHTMQSRARQFIVKRLFKNNMYFAGVSDAIRQDLVQHLKPLPDAHFLTLYNIIDYELFIPKILDRQDARTHLKCEPDDFIFGNVARLVPDKDQATLISAFALVNKHYPRTKLMILGDGKLEANLKQQVVAMGLESKVIFTGFVEDGFRFMKAFDVFVLSSISEAFGRVLLEAMIANIPIIATAVDGIPEVLGSTNQLVPARNPEQLAIAMQEYYQLSPEDRNTITTKSFQHMLDVFTPLAFKKQFWQLPVAHLIKDIDE